MEGWDILEDSDWLSWPPVLNLFKGFIGHGNYIIFVLSEIIQC